MVDPPVTALGGSLAELLAAGDVIVLDGGLATELERRGNDLSDRLWSARLLIEAPEEIVEAHLAYYRAGARVATTASYQASFEGFAARGIDHTVAAALMARSVELAAEARGRYLAECAAAGRDPGPLFVAASVGPYGAARADGSEYTGSYDVGPAGLRDWHRERLAVLAAAGPDLLAIETIPSVDEGQALVELLDEQNGPPAWLSYTCADGARTRHGEAVESAFALADATPRVVAVGVNCTAPEHVRELVQRARSVTAKPIIAYPNSGEGWDRVARRWVGGSGPTVDAAAARGWVAVGATLVGGCCRVGPDRIAELAAALPG
jgi:homocysteine S-methyltransferase